MHPAPPLTPPQSRPRKSRRWLILIAIAVALILVARRLLTGNEGFDWGLLRATLASLDLGWFALSVALSIASYYVRALRWAVLLEPTKPGANVWGIFEATSVGFTSIVFFGSPGEFVRPYVIALREKTTFATQAGVWLVERIFDFLAVLALFAWGLFEMRDAQSQVGPVLRWLFEFGGWAAAILITVCLALLVVLRGHSDWARRRIEEALEVMPEEARARLLPPVHSFLRAAAVTRQNYVFFATTGYTVLEWLLLAATYWTLLRAFPGVPVAVEGVLVLIGFLAFSGFIQLPGIGGGVQVVSILVLTELLKVPLEASTGVSLFIWIISYIVIVPFGLFFAAREGLSFKRLRHVQEDEAGETA